VKDGILKTACAFANNYMNREIGLLFIGIEEEDDKATGRKAVPVRPISGLEEAMIEETEEGHDTMCESFEKLANKYAEQIAEQIAEQRGDERAEQSRMDTTVKILKMGCPKLLSLLDFNHFDHRVRSPSRARV